MALIQSERRRDESAPSDRLLSDDPKRASSKIAIFQYLTVAVFVFLISGFWELQVKNPDVYSVAAERNRIKSTPVLAPRGKILDREGRVIVDNKASYSLLLNRDQIKAEHLPGIAEALQMDYGDLAAKIRRTASLPQIIVKDQLTRDDIAWVESHQDASTYPEMQLIKAWRRQYPQDGFAAHVIGYVGEISESELDSPQFIDYQQGDVIGKDGLERQYDQTLRGVDGQQRVLVDNFGRERQMEEEQPAVPGKDLRTTLDLDLQAVAELSMQDKRGAIVALDPRNGDVLAMVSRPTFDPNKFTGRISRTDWNQIAGDPYKPLMNRAIQAEFAPGSTFKPFTALAGLETGVIDDTTEFHCWGGASFYGHYYACWKKPPGHGNISLHRAIAQSCDAYFYNVANKLGIDRLAQYAEMAGFGHKTGIDLPNERESTMPSTKWKMRMFRQKWYAGEVISVGIGQGAVTASPLQLAAAEGGIAVGGKWVQPHLVKSAPLKVLNTGHVHPENVQLIVSGMYGVVNEGGTGRFAALPGIKVCGKTGTAQLASNQFLKGTAKGREMKDNAWFVGYAPEEAPEIVVVALFEGGEHGDRASWMVRDVLKAYFDKKARQQNAAILAARLESLPTLFTSPHEIATFRLALPGGLLQ
ncbi:MAG: penicillin-binding protein 2 [Acidobacteriaceae bacterium]|nr:penicillin-binding protein 2 [Acidobacteriaceae bacterium]